MEKMFKIVPPLVVGDTTVTQLEIAEYGNGRRAVQTYSVIRPEDGGDGTAVEPFDKLSVNLVDMRLMDDSHFFGMPYDYHKPLHDAALAAGLMEPSGEMGRAGMHGTVPAYRLTDKAMAIPAEA